MNAWISLLGIQNAFPDILDNMLLPNGVNKEILYPNLLMQTAELELTISSPPVLKMAIGFWSARRLPIWDQLEQTLHYEYNPIHNYDRTEEEHELETRDLTATTDRDYTSTENNEADTTIQKAGYDLGSLVTAEHDKVGEDNNRVDKDNAVGTDTGTIKHDRAHRAYGNIGVTTTQQMIEQQREVVQFDIYQYIIDDFKKEFCILVY